MANGCWWRRLVPIALLGLAEIVLLLTLSLTLPGVAQAQLFDDRFPGFWGNRRQRGDYQWQPFGPVQREEAPRQDFSKAPPPPRTDQPTTPPLTSIVVVGDSMADWLAYGLEQAYADSPDIGVVRKNRTYSGLIHNETKVDPRGLYPDWPQLAREIVNTDKANFVVIMLGMNDRQSIKPPPRPTTPQPNAAAGQPASPPSNAQTPNPATAAKPEAAAPQDDEQSPSSDQSAASEPPASKPLGSYDFHSDKWAELYSKRIDELIASSKSKGATVLWVGLPPVRGTKSTSDALYLNDLFRSRAEKAGIIYVDVWDGFVDDSGRYTQSGPDVEGQTRRLRAGDGVHFTQAGARKLAHYAEREIEHVMTSKATPIAVPVQIEAAQPAPATRPGGPIVRPLAGPVMPLTAALNAAGPDELMGGSAVHQSLSDTIATRVLVKGDPVPAPQGRADDFAWPRRGVASMGTDPVASTTTFPMTPMIAERPAQPSSASASLATDAGAQKDDSARAAQRITTPNGPRTAQSGLERNEPKRRPQSSPFFFLFPGR
jgi:uncharacterized protein